MINQLFPSGFKKTCLPADRKKGTRSKKIDAMTEQVKKMLQTADQKLILMVRG